MVTKQIKSFSGFHSKEVSLMQPLVIREPICQLMHFNLKLRVGNHLFYLSAFVRDAKVLPPPGPLLFPADLWPPWKRSATQRIDAASHCNYLSSLAFLCHCFHVLESVCQRECVGRQRGRDRDGVNEQLWQYFQYLLSSTECSCSGLWGAIKHPEMVGRFSL